MRLSVTPAALRARFGAVPGCPPAAADAGDAGTGLLAFAIGLCSAPAAQAWLGLAVAPAATQALKCDAILAAVRSAAGAIDTDRCRELLQLAGRPAPAPSTRPAPLLLQTLALAADEPPASAPAPAARRAPTAAICDGPAPVVAQRPLLAADLGGATAPVSRAWPAPSSAPTCAPQALGGGVVDLRQLLQWLQSAHPLSVAITPFCAAYGVLLGALPAGSKKAVDVPVEILLPLLLVFHALTGNPVLPTSSPALLQPSTFPAVAAGIDDGIAAYIATPEGAGALRALALGHFGSLRLLVAAASGTRTASATSDRAGLGATTFGGAPMSLTGLPLPATYVEPSSSASTVMAAKLGAALHTFAALVRACTNRSAPQQDTVAAQLLSAVTAFSATLAAVAVQLKKKDSPKLAEHMLAYVVSSLNEHVASEQERMAAAFAAGGLGSLDTSPADIIVAAADTLTVLSQAADDITTVATHELLPALRAMLAQRPPRDLVGNGGAGVPPAGHPRVAVGRVPAGQLRVFQALRDRLALPAQVLHVPAPVWEGQPVCLYHLIGLCLEPSPGPGATAQCPRAAASTRLHVPPATRATLLRSLVAAARQDLSPPQQEALCRAAGDPPARA